MRIWSLPGFPHIEQGTPSHEYNHCFWYCRKCSIRYAELRYADGLSSRRWAAKAGLCGNCSPDFQELPGSIGWWNYSLGLPEEVWAYELSCELRYVERQLESARTKEEA